MGNKPSTPHSDCSAFFAELKAQPQGILVMDNIDEVRCLLSRKPTKEERRMITEQIHILCEDLIKKDRWDLVGDIRYIGTLTPEECIEEMKAEVAEHYEMRHRRKYRSVLKQLIAASDI